MRKNIIFAVLLIAAPGARLHAAFNYVPLDPRATAMSGAMSAISNNVWGLFYNPATTGKHTGAAISYAIPYGDSDLDNIAGTINLSTLPFDTKGTYSFGVTRYSATDYHETTWLVGYAREVLPSIRLGVSLSRMTQEIDNFGNNSATGINAGLQVTLTPIITLGISSMNLNSPTIGETDTHLPRTTLTGLAFRFPTGSLLSVNLQTDPDRSSRLLAAGEFTVAPMSRVMIGLGTNPSLISGGISFGTDMLKATVAVSRDLDLGTTSSFGLEAGF